jgi:acetyltransferase-like isoleucine patch superfamily enzyme
MAWSGICPPSKDHFLFAPCQTLVTIRIFSSSLYGSRGGFGWRRKGLLLDHGTGCVIGATAVIGDRVSMMQGVTLGGTGKVDGDRHPKVGEGVLIGASATILGNIKVRPGCEKNNPLVFRQKRASTQAW